jgi:hypothetical protein
MPQYQDADLESVLDLHIKYGTYCEIVANNELIAVTRFNISHTGKIAYVLDMIIEPGHDSKKIMRTFIEEGQRRFPRVQYLHFTRSKKDGDNPVIVSINRFLKKIKGE